VSSWVGVWLPAEANPPHQFICLHGQPISTKVPTAINSHTLSNEHGHVLVNKSGIFHTVV